MDKILLTAGFYWVKRHPRKWTIAELRRDQRGNAKFYFNGLIEGCSIDELCDIDLRKIERVDDVMYIDHITKIEVID